MPAEITLDLTRDGLTLLHRTAAGWDRLGSVPMAAPDFRSRAEDLSREALKRSGGDSGARVILPDSQVLYTTVPASGLDQHADMERVRLALDGTTPYALADLQFDWRLSGKTLYVAVVARETLSEAAAFVAGCGLRAVSFSAMPDDNRFPGEPKFEVEPAVPEAPTESHDSPANPVEPATEPEAISPVEARPRDHEQTHGAGAADIAHPVADRTRAPDAILADVAPVETMGTTDLSAGDALDLSADVSKETASDTVTKTSADTPVTSGTPDAQVSGQSVASEDGPEEEVISFPTFVSARRVTAEPEPSVDVAVDAQTESSIEAAPAKKTRSRKGKDHKRTDGPTTKGSAPLPTFASVRARRLAAASAEAVGAASVAGSSATARAEPPLRSGSMSAQSADPTPRAVGGAARITAVSSDEADRLAASLEPNERKGKRGKKGTEKAGLASLLGVFKRKAGPQPSKGDAPASSSSQEAEREVAPAGLPPSPRFATNRPPPSVGAGKGSRLAEILEKGGAPSIDASAVLPKAGSVAPPVGSLGRLKVGKSADASRSSIGEKIAPAADALEADGTSGDLTTKKKADRPRKTTGLAGAIGGLARWRSKARGQSDRASRTGTGAAVDSPVTARDVAAVGPGSPGSGRGRVPTATDTTRADLRRETEGSVAASRSGADAGASKIKLPQSQDGLQTARPGRAGSGKASPTAALPPADAKPRLVPVRRNTSAATMPAPTGIAPSRDPNLTEAESLTVFGARRMQKENVARPGPRYLGLLLTLGLVGVMGLVALSSIWFGGDGEDVAEVASSVLTEPPAPLPQGTEPLASGIPAQPDQVAMARPDPAPPQAVQLPDPVEAPASVPEAEEDVASTPEGVSDAVPLPSEQVAPPESPAPGETLTALALPDPAPAPEVGVSTETGDTQPAQGALGSPPVPETAAAIAAARPAPNDPLAAPGLRLPPGPLDLGIARAAHSTTGIWLRAPERGFSPADDRLADVTIASVDDRGFEAAPPPLTAPTGPTDAKPPPVADPLRAESPAIYGPGGRVEATPEGALSPDGVTIYLGRPAILPPRRPADREVAVPGADPVEVAPPDPLRLFRPRPRPEDLTGLIAPLPSQEDPAPEPGLRPRARTAALGGSSVPPDALSDALEDAGAEVVADLPEDAGAGPAAGASTAALGLLPQPRPRPAELVDLPTTAEEPDIPVASASLAAVVPVARPDRLTALAPAPEEAPPEETEETVIAPPAFPDATDLAVAAVDRPRLRPANIEQIAARADRRAAAASTAAAVVAGTVAAPATPRVQDRGRGAETEEEPDDQVELASASRGRGPAVPRSERIAPTAPSSATVAKRATVRNAVNLRQVALIGVYGTPNQRRALVRLPTGRYVKVSVGDRVDGGRVASIGESNLSYTKRGRSVVLKMPKG